MANVIAENIEDATGNPFFKVKYEYRPAAESSGIKQLTYYNDVLKEIRFREAIFFDPL